MGWGSAGRWPVRVWPLAKCVCAQRNLKWKEEREWESMEANILSAENEVSDLEATFAAPDFYLKRRAEIFDLETELKTARDKVAHLYARWHELELLQSVPVSLGRTPPLASTSAMNISARDFVAGARETKPRGCDWHFLCP